MTQSDPSARLAGLLVPAELSSRPFKAWRLPLQLQRHGVDVKRLHWRATFGGVRISTLPTLTSEGS
jgi:hypothetical protein